MEKIKRTGQIATIVLLPLLLSACFAVRVIEDVKNPDRYFKKAYRQIDRIHKDHPNREGRPHKIYVLIYDESDRKLVKVVAPFWLVDVCMDIGEEVGNKDEFGLEERYDFDWKGLEDLEEIGPGLLVEIEDEKNKILIWIE